MHPENDIKDSLAALFEAVKRSDGEAVLRETRRLDASLASHRERLHPQLVHFLERRSYPKALQFLGGAADIPAGSCGGRP